MKQREIKFRMWNKANKKMYFGFCDKIIDHLKEPKGSDILMQYTGLHDKRWREIWEGDILDFIGDERFAGTDEVVFQKGSFVIRNSQREMSLAAMNMSEWKVIGNIMENPELLKNEI